CAECARRGAEARQALGEISSRLDDHLPVNIPVERLLSLVEDVIATPVARPSLISFSWRAGLVAASLLLTFGVVAWLVLTTSKPEQVAITPPQEKTDGAGLPGSSEVAPDQQPASAPGRKGGGKKPKSKSPQLTGSSRFAPHPEPPAPDAAAREGDYFFDFET